MFAPAISQTMSEFGSNNSRLASLVISIYVFGLASGPLVVSPMSELYGRLWPYHVSNVLFIIFTVACALSSNLGMLIAFRFLAGSVGSAVLNIGGGTVADLFVREERGKAMTLWTVGALLGPIAGPVAGGFLAEAWGWRSTFWVISIAASQSLVRPRLAVHKLTGDTRRPCRHSYSSS
jgi:multidrug resistance protein